MAINVSCPRSKASEIRVWRELNEWLTELPGTLVRHAENDAVEEILPNLFGYHLIQVGEQAGVDLTATSRIPHKAVFRVADAENGPKACALITNSAALPLAAGSVDVVILPHILEFCSEPHAVLREVERVLIGDGYVVIIGFNPISLWGLWRLFLAWRDQAPWNGHYFTVTRVKDWLALLGFEIVFRQKVFFRPPSRSETVNDRLRFLEKLGAHLWPFFGSVVLLVGKKRVVPLTVSRMNWKTSQRLIATEAVEPTTRASLRR